MLQRVLALTVVLAASGLAAADEVDKKYPLDAPLRVLAEDVENAEYRKLVTERMLTTDLAAEWKRVATADNPESFLARHGGKDKVLADPDLRKAYERRVAIRDKFLDLMRAGYARYKQKAPFDRGEKIDTIATITRTPGTAVDTLTAVLPGAEVERSWPRFRGPSGQGLTSATRLPVEWDKGGTNVRWRVKLTDHGRSSPVVWGERVFLTSATEDGSKRFVHCFDLKDGRLLWTRQAPARPPEPRVRSKNGYASATPVTDGERLVVFLGSCGLLCYDFDGNLLWHHDQLTFDTTHGTGSSPVLYKDKVLFIHDQNRAESVFLALDSKTGKVLWQRSRPKAMTWSTPLVVRVKDHDELIFAGAEKVTAYDPGTGEQLWSLDGPTVEVVPTVVVGNGLLYSASGRNGPVIALRPGGKGDVTETHLVWQTTRGGPHVPSPLYLDGRLYLVTDTGIFSCLDAATGKVVWQRRVLDGFSASPIEAGGLIYFPAESGVTYVLRAGDTFDLAARNDLGSPILASPAVVGKQMLIRTDAELICIAGK